MNAADRKSIGSFPRSAGGDRKARASADAHACPYPPGYFTALIAKHDWPPRFEPQFAPAVGGWSDARTLLETRERQAAEGVGWGGGTVVMPGTPKRKGRPALVKGRSA